MQVELNNKLYDVVIEYKNIKNMYLRISDDLSIMISCSKRIKEKDIIDFIYKNEDKVIKMINTKEKVNAKTKDNFLYLGNSYDICYLNIKNIEFGENKVFFSRNFNIDNWYKKQAKELFLEHLITCYSNFSRKIDYPSLKIRKMKTRWGVCNTKLKQVTLNLDLIKLDTKYLDYVINHELSHLIYHDHSNKFWDLVSENTYDYKKLRKEMKNIL